MQDKLTILGNRLAEYRSAADPHQYGVNMTGKRRTAGLRREEVAHGTGLSMEVISKLERGKYPSVNARLIHILSDYYHLDDAKRKHLLQLASEEDSTDKVELTYTVPPTIQQIVDHQREYPTFIINRRWDCIGWNEALNIVFGDIGSLPDEQRNILWIIFGNPAIQDVLVDWNRHAHRVAGQFRLDYDWSHGDTRFVDLVKQLSAVSPLFTELWKGPLDISFKESVFKQIRHPALGLLEFEQVSFRSTANWDLLIGVYHPTTEETAQKMLAALSKRTVLSSGHGVLHAALVK